MGSNTNLNLDLIAHDCGLFENKSADYVISKIEGLENNYRSEELILIYNYLLSKSQNPDIIMHLIKCCDKYRDNSSLEYFTNILLLKNNISDDENMKEKYTNVRIMCAKAIANQKNTDYISA